MSTMISPTGSPEQVASLLTALSKAQDDYYACDTLLGDLCSLEAVSSKVASLQALGLDAQASAALSDVSAIFTGLQQLSARLKTHWYDAEMTYATAKTGIQPGDGVAYVCRRLGRRHTIRVERADVSSVSGNVTFYGTNILRSGQLGKGSGHLSPDIDTITSIERRSA